MRSNTVSTRSNVITSYSIHYTKLYETSLTLLVALIPLVFFGPASLFGLTAAIVLGIFIGTYSSIYMAAPILVWLRVSSDSFVPKESEMDRHRITSYNVCYTKLLR